MISYRFRTPAAATVTIAALALCAHAGWAAEPKSAPAPTSGKAGTISTARPAAASASSTKSGARGPLPDPSLLDGSSHPPEKKSEHGMIGDFELPGDDNVRSGKVGGPQISLPMPFPTGGASGAQSSGGLPMGLPSGGGAQGQQSQQGGMPQIPAGGAEGGQQGGGGGPENPNAGGQPVAGGGDPGAQPQGVQVGQIQGAGGQQGGGQQAGGGEAGPGGKPPQVAIGDSAMRIEPTAAAAEAGVVGATQAAGHTQQHEKGTGSGGKGAGGAGGPNRVEKGRSIPAGL